MSAASEAPDPTAVPAGDDLLVALETTVLGGPAKYTRRDVAELTGAPIERLERLWRAMGFADVTDGVQLFTDADVEAVRTLDMFVGAGFFDSDRETSATRALGQAMSRLAEWQIAELRKVIDHAELDLGASGPDALALLGSTILPRMAEVQDYIWRRHLVSVGARMLLRLGDDDARELVVGFADLVGFTGLSRTLDQDDLAELVETFESHAAEAVAVFGGRVVKMMGDGVLFVAEDPLDGARIALQMVESMAEDPALPALRVGLAKGRVLTRLGDVYSSTVNLASRLTGIAKPNSVLVDGAFAEALGDSAPFRLRRLGRVSVRGLERQRPWLLRRPKPGEADSSRVDRAPGAIPGRQGSAGAKDDVIGGSSGRGRSRGQV